MRPPVAPAAVLAGVAALVALAGCGGGGGGAAKATATAASGSGSSGAAGSGGCRRVAQPPARSVAKRPAPATRLAPAKTWVATVSTSCGAFQITLDVKDSPKTTGSFAFLARRGFYDHTTFHRVVPGFVIQGGDPKGDGTGGPGYAVVEPPPRDVRYRPGVVAMAKTQFERSGTSGSQFFVVTGAKYQFAPEYAVLGRVSGGQATVDRIATAAADPRSGRPRNPIVIDSISVAAR